MDKLIKTISLLILMVLLISCGRIGANEPAAELSNDVSNSLDDAVLMAPALKPVEPLATAEMSVIGTPSAESEADMNPNPQSGVSDPIIGEAVTPVVVDLSQITPSAGNSNEQIVAPAPGVPDPLLPIVQAAKEDLAKRLGIDISGIGFVRSQAVNWSDSGLGCPQEGMMYMMVITPGYQVVLEAQGKEYFYHTGQTPQMFVFCENPPKDLPAPADQ